MDKDGDEESEALSLFEPDESLGSSSSSGPPPKDRNVIAVDFTSPPAASPPSAISLLSSKSTPSSSVLPLTSKRAILPSEPTDTNSTSPSSVVWKANPTHGVSGACVLCFPMKSNALVGSWPSDGS